MAYIDNAYFNKSNPLTGIMNSLGQTLGNAVSNTAQQAIQGVMNHQGNAVSAQAQMAAGNFNQGSADLANALDTGRLQNQYNFNAAQAASANAYNQTAWENAAAWNEMMWQKQADFNAEQAKIQRDWQERMSNTQYQRAMTDMQKAGLNPILAYSQGGAGIPGGAAATVGGAQMSSAQANMASGGLLGADSASVQGYQGMAEWTSGILGLLAGAFLGMSSAENAKAQLDAMTGGSGGGIIAGLQSALTGEATNEEGDKISYGKIGNLKNAINSGIDYIKNGGKEGVVKDIHNRRSQKKNNVISNRVDESQYLRYNAWNNSTWKYTRPKG